MGEYLFAVVRGIDRIRDKTIADMIDKIALKDDRRPTAMMRRRAAAL